MHFRCQQFSIKQTDNSQKVGSDSMVLGAWTKGNFTRILDIGTGTGLLALMQAQHHPKAQIIAIEPDSSSCREAQYNFEQSPFKDRLKAVPTRLQDYKTDNLFDLIITNPPYFDGDSLSDNPDRNRARHTVDLPIQDLYAGISGLLATNGKCHIVVPESVYQLHLNTAQQYNLWPYSKLIGTTETGHAIRYFIGFQKSEPTACHSESMVMKYSDGLYSKRYVSLTSQFYLKNLPSR